MMILAVDPGKDKIGLAVLDDQRKIHLKKIILSQEIDSYLISLFRKYKLNRVIIGNGTTGDKVKEVIASLVGKEIPLEMVDERGTTLEAEKRYREENTLRWLRKITKFITWKPGKPVDDYVAVILAERYLQEMG